jgi:hypothetical protein
MTALVPNNQRPLRSIVKKNPQPIFAFPIIEVGDGIGLCPRPT